MLRIKIEQEIQLLTKGLQLRTAVSLRATNDHVSIFLIAMANTTPILWRLDGALTCALASLSTAFDQVRFVATIFLSIINRS